MKIFKKQTVVIFLISLFTLVNLLNSYSYSYSISIEFYEHNKDNYYFFIEEDNNSYQKISNTFNSKILNNNDIESTVWKTLNSSAKSIAIGPNSMVYVAGHANLSNILVKNNSTSVYLRESIDCFIAIISPDLKSLQKVAFFGGSDKDFINSIKIGPSGDVYVAGVTYSDDFPLTNDGPQIIARSSLSSINAFITKFSHDLQTMKQSTYLGGPGGSTSISSMQIGPEGEVYVAGGTSSYRFPMTSNGAQNTLRGLSDGFVSKFSADLRTLHQSTYLGGSNSESISSLKIGPQGNVFVCGYTNSYNFPHVEGSAHETFNNNISGFLSIISGDLTSIKQSTYLEGSKYGNLIDLDIGPQGELYVIGTTLSSDFPGTINGAYANLTGEIDGIIAKLSPDLKTLYQASYIGGTGRDYIYSVQIDKTGNIFVAGMTTSTDLPKTYGGAIEKLEKDQRKGFIAKFSPDLKLLQQSSFLGGTNGFDIIHSIKIDSQGSIYAIGVTNSTDFPKIKNGAIDSVERVAPIGFVTKLTEDLKNIQQSTYTNRQ